MNRSGIPTLNAGAYDNLPGSSLRLSGDQRPTYTQRRRTQMAGGGIMGSNAGSMLVAPTADGSRPGYAWYDNAWDTIKTVGQTIIPGGDPGYIDLYGGTPNIPDSDLRTPPYFPSSDSDYGLGESDLRTPPYFPSSDYGFDDSGDFTGEGFPQDTPDSDYGFDDSGDFTGEGFGTPPYYPDSDYGYGDEYGGMPPLSTPPYYPDSDDQDYESGEHWEIPPEKEEKSAWEKGWDIAKEVGKTLWPGGDPGYVNLYDVTPGDPSIARQAANIGVPLGIGKWAHDYQRDWLKDQPKFPADQTSINFQTAQQAMDDPNLRFKPKAQYADVAEGGRIGYQDGGNDPQAQLIAAYKKYKAMGGTMTIKQFAPLWAKGGMAQGGRIGYQDGERVGDLPEVLGPVTPGKGITDIDTGDFNLSDSAEYTQMYPSNPELRAKILAIVKKLMQLNPRLPSEKVIRMAIQIAKKGMEGLSQDDTGGREIIDRLKQPGERSGPKRRWGDVMPPRDFPSDEGILAPPRDFPPDEGIIAPPRKLPENWKRFLPGESRVGAQEGGLMNLGGMEKDYRQEGGFVPIGGEEKADDVPARLSKNEFVFTADAVRAAGGGDIDAGAEVMEKVMDNLEAGGKISEESQGLEGAREMFANTQKLQNRII